MIMKKTILSSKELRILETLLANYGSIVTFEQIHNELKELNRQSVRNLVNKFSNNGWLIRIKKSFYAIANLESHNFANISPLVISRIFVPDSYVSFEFALNHYGLFDQLPNKVTAVTPIKSKSYHFQNIEYKFIKTKLEMMSGFQTATLDGQQAKIAEIEKALLDFLYFRKDSYTADLVLEKLKETRQKINIQKLVNFAQLYSITVRRRLGFLMDAAALDSEALYNLLKKTPGFARLTKDSKQFNSKWRLYYENRFTK